MKKNVTSKNLPTRDMAEKFDMLYPILETVLNEIKEFLKKKQDEPLNKLKVKMVNKILEQVRALLKDDPASQFFDELDDEILPTNSDAVLIIAQYKAAMEQFKKKFYGFDGNTYHWFMKEE
jgi:uncharacterized protein YaaW (UPF0174 family)